MVYPSRPYIAEEQSQHQIRIVVADGHPDTRAAIMNELARHPDLAMLGTAATSDDILRLAETLHPDVLLLNITTPDLSAADLVGQVQALPLPPQIVAYEDSQSILLMLENNAIDHLLRDEYSAAITAAVRAVTRSERGPITAAAGRTVEPPVGETPQPAAVALSRRELDVLRLLARGHTNCEIAEALAISEGTVKNHVTRLYHKLGVYSRAEAVAWAWQHGLVDDTRAGGSLYSSPK